MEIMKRRREGAAGAKIRQSSGKRQGNGFFGYGFFCFSRLAALSGGAR
jgi:hypothetical protein